MPIVAEIRSVFFAGCGDSQRNHNFAVLEVLWFLWQSYASSGKVMVFLAKVLRVKRFCGLMLRHYCTDGAKAI
jgi:hypothetical protein